MSWGLVGFMGRNWKEDMLNGLCGNEESSLLCSVEIKEGAPRVHGDLEGQ
jgi:hypothetical protein